MPYYWYPPYTSTNAASFVLYHATSATTATEYFYIPVQTTVTTATTAPTIAWADWQSYSPAPAASRLYVAQRSRQALADDLHDFYLTEERRQRTQLERHTAEARAKSLDLLRAHLSPAQRESFEKNKFFVIEGGKSKQRYRINASRHMVANIDVLDGYDGKEIRLFRLCGHCDLKEVPLYDQLLAQKMMLELDEDRFLRLANRHAA